MNDFGMKPRVGFGCTHQVWSIIWLHAKIIHAALLQWMLLTYQNVLLTSPLWKLFCPKPLCWLRSRGVDIQELDCIVFTIYLHAHQYIFKPKREYGLKVKTSEMKLKIVINFNDLILGEDLTHTTDKVYTMHAHNLLDLPIPGLMYKSQCSIQHTMESVGNYVSPYFMDTVRKYATSLFEVL